MEKVARVRCRGVRYARGKQKLTPPTKGDVLRCIQLLLFFFSFLLDSKRFGRV